jgi:hypothetical protein
MVVPSTSMLLISYTPERAEDSLPIRCCIRGE